MLFLLIFLVIDIASSDCPTNFELFGSRCYFVSSENKNYHDASSFCRSLKSHLPSITNDEEQDSLIQIRSSNVFFLGLEFDFNNELWFWEDGRPFNSSVAQFEDSSCYKMCSNMDARTRFKLSDTGLWEIIWDSADIQLVCATDEDGGNIDGDDFCCWWLLYYVLPIGSSIFGCLFLSLCCIALRRRAREQHETMMEYAQKNTQLESEIQRNAEWVNERKEYLEKFNELKKDEWEVERRFVDVDWSVELGNGAFGKVYKGTLPAEKLPSKSLESVIQVSELKKNDEKIAVKMLHESADRSTVLAFLDEIELMKNIGYHERLVNLLACVTESEPRMLIVELCIKGDLLRYMTQRREYMLSHRMDEVTDYNLVITHKHQFIFAVQIASGLLREFLSHRGFVHRDIAARNILVNRNDSVKIGDFGLCRKIVEDDGMYLSRGGRMPIKWMAPEALKDYEASSASDVWSFGVLLFEIVTLGGSPYAGWNIAEILLRLERGERMERPDECTDQMHEIMQSCWKFNPRERPDFTELRMKLGKALEKVTDDNYYLQLDGRKEYYLVSNERKEKVRNEKGTLPEESEL